MFEAMVCDRDFDRGLRAWRFRGVKPVICVQLATVAAGQAALRVILDVDEMRRSVHKPSRFEAELLADLEPALPRGIMWAVHVTWLGKRDQSKTRASHYMESLFGSVQATVAAHGLR
jgi:hypothetical protein